MDNRPISVLLIEDNPGDTRLVQEMFSEINNRTSHYELECANELTKGLKHLAKGGIDVVLLDLSLPDSQEIDTYDRTSAQAPNVPIVVLSGQADEKLAIETIKQGAQDYLIKGQIDSNLLVRSIRYAIERKTLIRELNIKNRELQQIVYITSHDLRSPLVTINGFSEELKQAFEEVQSVLESGESPSVVRDKLAPALKEDIPEALRYIFACTSKMDSVISGMLQISRTGSEAITIKQLDMNKLMSAVVNVIDHTIKKMDTTLHLEGLPPSRGDEKQINQVFSNLLDNAIKYLDPGKKGIIKISGRKARGQVEYCVEDNGIGIPADRQDKIFEIFQRLNPDDSDGEGLGLTIIHKILDRHDGKIRVQSEPGKGSKFFVSLPE